MEYVWILIAAFISSAITNIIFFIKFKNVGTIRIDHSDPDKDVYRIDVGDLDKLSKRKRIVLSVDNNADLSQK